MDYPRALGLNQWGKEKNPSEDCLIEIRWACEICVILNHLSVKPILVGPHRLQQLKAMLLAEQIKQGEQHLHTRDLLDISPMQSFVRTESRRQTKFIFQF